MLPVNDVNELVKKAVALNKQNSYLSFLFMKDIFLGAQTIRCC